MIRGGKSRSDGEDRKRGKEVQPIRKSGWHRCSFPFTTSTRFFVISLHQTFSFFRFLNMAETQWTEKVTGLPPCYRHIATHDVNGKSIYHPSPPQVYTPIPGTGGLARSFSVGTVPAILEDEKDIKAYSISDPSESMTSFKDQNIVGPSPSGANCLVVDLEPGGMSQLHRTVSIDFSICVIGTIEHELDSGERVTLRPGDHIVQRGTMHRWHNASKIEPARFVAVTIPCVPFEIPGSGKMLKQEFLSKDSENL